MTRPRTFDHERALAMLDDGCTLAKIQTELGCTRDALYNVRRRHSHRLRFRQGTKPIDRERIAWLTDRGWSARRIAETLGCSKRTVERARSELRR